MELRGNACCDCVDAPDRFKPVVPSSGRKCNQRYDTGIGLGAGRRSCARVGAHGRSTRQRGRKERAEEVRRREQRATSPGARTGPARAMVRASASRYSVSPEVCSKASCLQPAIGRACLTDDLVTGPGRLLRGCIFLIGDGVELCQERGEAAPLRIEEAPFVLEGLRCFRARLRARRSGTAGLGRRIRRPLGRGAGAGLRVFSPQVLDIPFDRGQQLLPLRLCDGNDGRRRRNWRFLAMHIVLHGRCIFDPSDELRQVVVEHAHARASGRFLCGVLTS